MKRINLLAASLLLTGITFAQTERNCGTMPNLERQMEKDHRIAENRSQIEDFTQRYIKRQKTQKAAAVSYNIPVVVHVVYNSSTQNISDAQIQSQLDVLNADFNRTNSDASSTPSYFSSIAANSNITFCLASTDPNGNATSGIVRKSTTRTSFSDNDYVKSNNTGGSSAWPRGEYLNIWVCRLASGLLGYAQFPGGGSASTDGVVIGYNYFGTTGAVSYPFNKGRTTTHEVGHWLNLYHIWGDSYCGNDQVSDTPTQSSSNNGCPSFPKSSCSNYSDMYMNYMDYTNDACMNMFSTGQSNRMRAVLASGGFRASLANSTACGSSGGGSTGGGTTSYCGSEGSNSSYEWIANVTVGSINNSTGDNGGYQDFTSQSADVSVGETVNFSLTPGFSGSTYNEYWKIWIDYNQDNDFDDAGELVYDQGGMSPNAVSGSFVVSSAATSGATRMRVSMKYNGAQTACETFQYGEVEDYTINIGTASCDVPTNLAASGISATGATLNWTDMGSASYQFAYRASGGSWAYSTQSGTSKSLSGLSAATNYDWSVRSICGSESSAWATVESFTTSSAVVNYCASKGSNSYYEWIASVKLNSINNPTGDDGGYKDYTDKSTTINKGSSYTVNLSPGFRSTTYNEYWKVWVDYNQDGVFNDEEELVYDSNGMSSGNVSGSFVVPSSAANGSTRMRVSMKYNGEQTSCETFSYGEVEDYTVVIGGSARLDVSLLTDVKLFPNPTSGTFTVEGQGLIGGEVYSLDGRLVKRLGVSDFNHPISIDKQGVYLLKIYGTNETVMKRLVVQ